MTAPRYANDAASVADGFGPSIYIRDPEGNRIDSIGPTLPGGLELRSPEDIAVDGHGRLLIADRGLAQIFILE